MNEKIVSRINKLRVAMRQNGISAFLINGCDPHLGEYVPARWETRSFISGFTGSYGWLAITLEEAALWTDSRYYLQATIELEGTGILMHKARLPETVFIGDWVTQRLNKGQTVGFDGSCYSVSECNLLANSFAKKQLEISYNKDLLNDIWDDRPVIPKGKAFLHPLKWAGISRKDKFKRISSELEKYGADLTIITALDDLCWTFNVRGSDVNYSPLVLGFGIIDRNGNARLYTDQNKFSSTELTELQNDSVELFPYNTFLSHLFGYKEYEILIDPDRTNYSIFKHLEKKNSLIHTLSIPCLLKSIKNENEINGYKQASLSDGLAFLNFQLWLEQTIGKERVTEYDVLMKLAEFRSQMPGYKGESCYAIVGYRDHGAIVHLHITKEEAYELKREGILLFDSGGQYEYGTTDITRTIALGEITEQMKTDFTITLKGMIALSDIRFPKGTIGCHLDVLARQAMWMNRMNYGHGTCHGVGAYLNIHEGPQSIRPDLNNHPILPGNVITNEPAFYREGLYGLRTENMMVCVEDGISEYGEFYRFETLTLFPVDNQLIDKSLFDESEINWLNSYHKTVFEKLSPFTNPEQLALLKRLTKSL